MITLALALFIVVASLAADLSWAILQRIRPLGNVQRAPDTSRATRSRTPAAETEREKILNSLAYYDDQLTRLQALAEAARAAEKAAGRAVDLDADANRYGGVVSEKIRAKHAAELDRATRRVIALNRSIYQYETARSRTAEKLKT
jgi:regulator of protease activity HflC (stomatin/prohibitin superfamily)